MLPWERHKLATGGGGAQAGGGGGGELGGSRRASGGGSRSGSGGSGGSSEEEKADVEAAGEDVGVEAEVERAELVARRGEEDRSGGLFPWQRFKRSSGVAATAAEDVQEPLPFREHGSGEEAPPWQGLQPEPPSGVATVEDSAEGGVVGAAGGPGKSPKKGKKATKGAKVAAEVETTWQRFKEGAGTAAVSSKANEALQKAKTISGAAGITMPGAPEKQPKRPDKKPKKEQGHAPREDEPAPRAEEAFGGRPPWERDSQGSQLHAMGAEVGGEDDLDSFQPPSDGLLPWERLTPQPDTTPVADGGQDTSDEGPDAAPAPPSGSSAQLAAGLGSEGAESEADDVDDGGMAPLSRRRGSEVSSEEGGKDDEYSEHGEPEEEEEEAREGSAGEGGEGGDLWPWERESFMELLFGEEGEEEDGEAASQASEPLLRSAELRRARRQRRVSAGYCRHFKFRRHRESAAEQHRQNSRSSLGSLPSGLAVGGRHGSEEGFSSSAGSLGGSSSGRLEEGMSGRRSSLGSLLGALIPGQRASGEGARLGSMLGGLAGALGADEGEAKDSVTQQSPTLSDELLEDDGLEDELVSWLQSLGGGVYVTFSEWRRVERRRHMGGSEEGSGEGDAEEAEGEEEGEEEGVEPAEASTLARASLPWLPKQRAEPPKEALDPDETESLAGGFGFRWAPTLPRRSRTSAAAVDVVGLGISSA